jgi:hypothetical protein
MGVCELPGVVDLSLHQDELDLHLLQVAPVSLEQQLNLFVIFNFTFCFKTIGETSL